jgi:hypothetical protein
MFMVLIQTAFVSIADRECGLISDRASLSSGEAQRRVRRDLSLRILLSAEVQSGAFPPISRAIEAYGDPHREVKPMPLVRTREEGSRGFFWIDF